MVDRLVEAGMDAARLNLSHGTHEEHARRAGVIREAQDRAGRPLAVIADLQGPKLRVGRLAEPRMLVEGEEIMVVGDGDSANGSGDGLPVSPSVLSEVLRPGDDVLIDDGLVRLRVLAVTGDGVRANVVVGGAVGAGKGVNVPGVPLPVPSVTEKDTSG